MPAKLSKFTMFLLMSGLLSGQVAAQTQLGNEDTAGDAALTVELNTVTPLNAGCRLTFMATNAMPADIGKLVLETVLLTTEGTVDRLTLFDMQDLPANRPRVRQFDVPNLTCNALGKVLINGVGTCDGDGLDPTTCAGRLELTSRTDVEILG